MPEQYLLDYLVSFFSVSKPIRLITMTYNQNKVDRDFSLQSLGHTNLHLKIKM